MKISIAIAEDNYFLAQSLVEKLSFFEQLSVSFLAENGVELIEKLNKVHHIDVILMDIQMPKLNGIQATEKIKNRFQKSKIIMLTIFNEDENIFNSIKAGANGYLLKEIDPESLHKAILEVMSGGAPMTPSIALKTINLLRNPLPISSDSNMEATKLSKREIEVLVHLSKGLNYKLIAGNLFISTGTVRKHIENIYRKLQVHNKIEAIQKAKKERII